MPVTNLNFKSKVWQLQTSITGFSLSRDFPISIFSNTAWSFKRLCDRDCTQNISLV